MWHSRHSMVLAASPGWFQRLFFQLSYWFWSWTQPTLFTSCVDELLVAGGAVLGRLEQALGEVLHVLTRIGADQEVPRESRRPPVAQLEEVTRRWRHHEVGVALHVRLADGVAREAGDAFLVADEVGQVRREDVLGAREERDRVVTAAAVSRRLGAVLLGHLSLHALEGRVHGRPAVGADAPLLVRSPRDSPRSRTTRSPKGLGSRGPGPWKSWRGSAQRDARGRT